MRAPRLSPQQRQALDTLKRIGGLATTFQITANMYPDYQASNMSVNGVAQSLSALEGKGLVSEIHTKGRRGGDRLWKYVEARP